MDNRRKTNYVISFLVIVFLLTLLPAFAFADFYVVPVGGRSVLPSNVVELGTTSIAPGGSDGLARISTEATNLGDITVPAG